MKKFFARARFLVTDAWKSRGRSRPARGGQRFYRDISGLRGDASFSAEQIDQLNESGIRPDHHGKRR